MQAEVTYFGKKSLFKPLKLKLYFQVGWKPVSRILHHIHLCLIYEAIMRHIRDKYDAIMKQISLIFSKNEVLGPAFLFTAKPL